LKEFGILRLSRLYPLHLVTLILAAVGQYMMWHIYGAWLSYENNDVGHFISQLLFASAWGAGNSFNGPSWSISVEIALYGVFFLTCYFGCVRWWHLLIYAIGGEFWFLHQGMNGGMARGVLGFFTGGLAFHAYRYLWRRQISARVIKTFVILTMFLWVVVPIEVENQYLCHFYDSITGQHGGMATRLLGKLIFRFSEGGYTLLLFPFTIMTLGFLESWRGTFGKRAAFLGDISYSTYMIHFPLQMVFIITAHVLHFPTTFFSRPLSMLLFFVTLIPLSLASYHFLERPAQKYFRSVFLPPVKKTPVQQASSG
jgi:peptidoglycan/LPS O-acetylase OafA/YrhL